MKPEQAVVVKILSIDQDQRRISLSLRAALPQEVVKTTEEEEETAEETEVKPRARNIPLRGGVGQDSWLPGEKEDRSEE